MAQSDGLFSAELLSPDVASALPSGYRLRALRKSDFTSGFLDCLRVLTTVGDLTAAQFEKQYDWMISQGSYYIIVIEDTSRTKQPVVATGALILERKLCGPPAPCYRRDTMADRVRSIHNLGLVGHIEDIAVAKDQQGKKLGLRLIQALDFIAAKLGCYKSILDCSEANEGFYVKCGFRKAGLEMAHYFDGSKRKSQ